MARAMQPFSGYEDGDMLFAVSTQEVGDADSKPTTFLADFVAAETRWDAILASVPGDPVPPPGQESTLMSDQMTKLTGHYRIGLNAVLDIAFGGGRLTATLVRAGVRAAFITYDTN